MHPARHLLLSSYYYTTLPWRSVRNAACRLTGRQPACVLFYHRIADRWQNPWTTNRRVFERQLHWLKRHFDLVTLDEIQNRMRGQAGRRPAVAITFDDGYAENCEHALPLLIAENIPFTYFVTTKNILTGKPFPHDVVLGHPLRPNSTEQIRQLASYGIEVGVHTRTHADLGQVESPDALYDEVVLARQEVEEITGVRPRYFAFPYGQKSNLSQQAFQLARDCGYDGACSAYGGYNFPGDDPFHIQRIHADNDLIRLKNWLTVDPRKLRSTERYVLESAPAHEAAEVGA